MQKATYVASQVLLARATPRQVLIIVLVVIIIVLGLFPGFCKLFAFHCRLLSIGHRSLRV